ncbi:MAG: high frequency lysogenization protein HflD [Cocleimonas sp.]|nr:high frequency lysogenization protein HflD [Cocleimonas sp.]
MEANTRNRTLALSALFLSIHAVMQIAHKGKCDSHVLSICLGSLVHNNTDNIEDIYGGLANLKLGLGALMYNLGGGQLDPNGRPKNMESTRYSINILHLQRKLMQNREVYDDLMKGIQEAQGKLEFFELTHPNIIASLAKTYTQTISKLGPRIMIKGDQTALAVPDNAAKIRALLLAATRAALLWEQAGGGRWKLLFERSKMQKQADQLLAEIASN